MRLRGDWLLTAALLCGAHVILVRGDCANPPRLNNGFPDVDLSLTSFSVGTRIRYRCYPGYLLAEGKSPIVTCKADTSWTAIRTECEARSCGAPPDIEHGYYQTTSVVFGGRVTYRCDEGYDLVGKATRNCVSEGWDGRSPECDPVACPDLPPIQNGRTPQPPQDFWVYPNAAVFTCNPTYTLIGENTINCQANRQWSDNPPQCKVVACLRPPAIANAEISSGFGPKYSYRDVIVYKCKEGFHIVGKSIIKCREDSTFEQGPRCEKETTPTSLPIPSTETTPTSLSIPSTGRAPATIPGSTDQTHIPTAVNNTGLIVGVVIGVISVVSIVLGLIYYFFKKSNGNSEKVEKVPMNPPPTDVQAGPFTSGDRSDVL